MDPDSDWPWTAFLLTSSWGEQVVPSGPTRALNPPRRLFSFPDCGGAANNRDDRYTARECRDNHGTGPAAGRAIALSPGGFAPHSGPGHRCTSAPRARVAAPGILGSWPPHLVRAH